MIKKNGMLISIINKDIDNILSQDLEDIISINEGAFSYCNNLSEIILPENIITIGDSAFSSCEHLKEVIFNKNIETISERAFYNCVNLEKIIFNEKSNELTINDSAFHNCKSLKEIISPKKMREIITPFTLCENLERIVLPQSYVLPSGKEFYLFKECKNIKYVEFYNQEYYEFMPSKNNFNYFGIGKGNKMILSSEPIVDNDINKIFNLKEINKVIVSDDFSILLDKLVNENLYESYLKIKDNNIIFPLEIINEEFNGKNFIQMKNLIKLMKKKLGKIDTSHLVGLYKLAYNFGVLENPCDMIKIKNQAVPVRDVSYTLLQGIFIKEYWKFDALNIHFKDMQMKTFNKEFLKFMLNKNNLDEVLDYEEMHPGILTRICDWYCDRMNYAITGEDVSDNYPKVEENRYKILSYESSKYGVDKVKWKHPTLKLLLKEFSTIKFKGINNDNIHIANYLSQFKQYEQKHFEKAIEIDKERRRLVEEGYIKNNLTETIIKEDVVDSLEDYKERIKKLKNKIKDNCIDTLNNQISTREMIFTYEMLDKSSPENFAIGLLTDCCATLYGSGGGAQRAMIVHPDMQPLVIRDIKGKIIAFGIIYVNKEKGYAVVNDFEVARKFKDEIIIKEIYQKAIQGVVAFTDQYNKENKDNPIRLVTCGVTLNLNAINDYIRENPDSLVLTAPNFSEFQYSGIGRWDGDWHEEQYILYKPIIKELKR